MRNLKKILALVLALVMSMSLMAGASFKDAESIDGKYNEATAVLNELKVFQGRPDGSFDPKAPITRAEVAAIIYRIVSKDVTDAQVSFYKDLNKFTDVKSTNWFAGYVNYCANGEYVKGYAGKFNPNNTVTGYEALAMILRAIGYDKNHEFSGPQWQTKVATTAQQRGLLVNLADVVLGQPATREVVAEILFQTILVPQVEYTPALGYQIYGATSLGVANDSLGYQNFGLVGPVVGQDVWGRPATKWMIDLNKNKVADVNTDKKLVDIAHKPVVKYNVAVDECQIAHDLKLDRAANIEASFQNGRANAIDNNKLIEPLATTQIMGAQGRQTEIFNMGADGYRVVEIDTFLAKVTKVNPAFTDKNNHVVEATVEVEVYYAGDTADNRAKEQPLTFKTDKFTLGQYVLVNVTDIGTVSAKIREMAPANVAAGGALVAYNNGVMGSNSPRLATPDTTTINATKYNDSVTFYLNRRASGNWQVITDNDGNLIGLAQADRNYLVVEGMRWTDDSFSVFGGKAIADVVLADGTRHQNVTVSAINYNGMTKAPVFVSAGQEGDPTNHTVSVAEYNNRAYTDHIVEYTLDGNGNYILGDAKHDVSNVAHLAATGAKDATNVTFNPNNTTFVDGSAYVGLNDHTVFLVEGSDGKYTAFTGKNNVPSMTAASVCYLVPTGSSYASLVVAKNVTYKSNTFDAYVDISAGPVGLEPNGWAFEVYKAGETTPTKVYWPAAAAPATIPASRTDVDGIFTIQVNDKMQMVDNSGRVNGDASFVASEAQAKHVNSTYTGEHEVTGWDRADVTAKEGNTLLGTDTSKFKYWVDDAAIILVKYNGAFAVSNPAALISLEKVDASAITWAGAKVVVNYTKNPNGQKIASTVYVFEDVSTSTTIPAITSYNVTTTGAVANTKVYDLKFTATSATPAGVALKVNNVKWYVRNASELTFRECGADDVFASGFVYYATMDVVVDGHDSLTHSINNSTTWNYASGVKTGTGAKVEIPAFQMP